MHSEVLREAYLASSEHPRDHGSLEAHSDVRTAYKLTANGIVHLNDEFSHEELVALGEETDDED